MLFILFFFLRDGRTLARQAIELVPVAPARRAQALKYLGEVTRAVVFGSVITALVQGLLVAIGFAIAGLPSPVVFGVLAVFASFLPSGASIVVIPAILYFAFTGHWGKAVFLLAWAGLLAARTTCCARSSPPATRKCQPWHCSSAPSAGRLPSASWAWCWDLCW